jgi:tRNA(Ile)-lysidine synthase
MTSSGPDLTASLVERCNFPSPGTHLDCAVSGGPDSLALLVLACAHGCEVVAWHVDHGLRPGSADEAGVVEEAAERFGARFVATRAEVEPGPNLEARARAARRRVLPAGHATGHTADDQAETVLINMLRGAGLDGLAGMRHDHTHPLLELRRSETRSLTEGLGLAPVSDPSNFDPAYLRNRVRHELLPLCSELARRDVVPILARQARLLAEDATHLDLEAALEAESWWGLAGSGAEGVPVAPLLGLSAPLARRALRALLRDGDEAHPPGLAAVERVLAVARGEAVACDIEGGRHVRRSRGRLYVEPARPAN